MPASIFQGTAVKILKNVLKFADGTTLSSTVAGYLANITSDVQTQIDNLGAPSFAYTAETAGATLAIGEYAVVSGASGDITLPTAASNAGKSIIIEHGGTSLTQKYTVQTTSSQTIGGIAGGSYVLCTAGEVLHVVSDGSNWRIANHKTATPWTSYTPSFNGLGSPTSITAKWRRNGDTMEVNATWLNGTTTADPAKFSLPTGATIDTGKILPSGTQLLGHGYGTVTTTNTAIPTGSRGPLAATCSSSDTGNFLLSGAVDLDAGIFTNQNGNVVGTASGQGMVFQLSGIPISDWQP